MTKATRVALSVLSAIAVALLLAVAAVRTHLLWTEYYGDGPPYYGMTTNMDKWENPLPGLIVWNAATLTLVAVLVYCVFRMWRTSRASS